MKMRGIRPDFWTDEALVETSIPARLLFVGLWMLACDNGHVRDRSRRIKLQLFPADDINVNALIQELADAGVLVRRDGWLIIPKLPKHQKIDMRYFLTCDAEGCEKPQRNSSSSAQNPAGPRRGHALPRDEGEGESEGEGEGESVLTSVGGHNAADATPPESESQTQSKAKTKRASRLPDDFVPSQESRTKMLAEVPGIDLKREHAKFVDYYQAQPGQRGVRANWDATWRNWMRKAGEMVGSRRSRQQETEELFGAAMERARAADAANDTGGAAGGVVL